MARGGDGKKGFIECTDCTKSTARRPHLVMCCTCWHVRASLGQGPATKITSYLFALFVLGLLAHGPVDGGPALSDPVDGLHAQDVSDGSGCRGVGIH